MQEQTFRTEELKAELERALGFELKSLVRLDGASACNFKAVRRSDGLSFAVKCSPSDRQAAFFDPLVANLRTLSGARIAERIFERECPATFRGYNLLCQAWVEGVRVFPDRLTDTEFGTFLDDYLDFSKALQKCTKVRPLPAWTTLYDYFRRQASKGLWWRLMVRFIERETPRETLVYAPDLVRNVHADFHHGNFLFVNGRVNGYMDLEEICLGYPAEDIVRYLVCAAEHLKVRELPRTRRILHLFSLAVRRMPYSRAEWMLAVNLSLFIKIAHKLEGRRPTPAMLLNLKFKSVLYRKMKEVLAHEPAEG